MEPEQHRPQYKLGTPLCKARDGRFHFAPYERHKSLPPTNSKKKRVETPREKHFQDTTLDAFGKKVVSEKQYVCDIRYLAMQLERIEKRIGNIDLVQYQLASTVADLKRSINDLHTELILSQPAQSLTAEWVFDTNKF